MVRDLAFGSGDQRIAVGAVRVPLWSAAFAQSSDSFNLENVSFAVGGETYEAKRIEFSGVTSSRADIEALFSASSTEPMASRLARISAKQVTIPEVRMTQKLGSSTQTAVYKNVALNEIAQGRIASASVETTGVEATSSKGSALFSYGRTAISDLDLPAFAKLYETKAETDPASMTRIQGAFSIDNIEIVENGEGVTFKVARVNGRDFMARPTRDSWAGTVALFTELADKDNLPKEDKARLAQAVADFLGAFDIGFVEATGTEMKADAKGKAVAEGRASPVTARINRIAYTGSAGSQPADARVEGLEIIQQDGRLRADTISLTGFSIRPTLEGLKGLAGRTLGELDTAAMRNLVPTLGTLRLSGLDFDLPAEDSKGAGAERVKATLKDLELTADRPVNAIPTNIRIGLQSLAMALPADSEDDGVKELVALGYKNIDASLQVAATWNEASSEITLNEVSIQGQDMGRATLTGVIGNVSKDLFSPDEATAATALIGAKAKSADLVIENKGLFERYLARAAKEQKTKPESLQRLYASATPLVMSSLVGSTEQAKTLGQAIARFIAQPGKLTINAQPKNPSGFGMMDIMLASDPKAILEKLNIAAKVE